MTVRDKILEALGDIDNISDERLCDLLLDAFAEQRKKIEQLEAFNNAERISLRNEQEALRQEQRRVRQDPLYAAAGDYYFVVRDRFFQLAIQGNRMQLIEAVRGDEAMPWVNYMGQQLSRQEWENRK